MSDALHTLRTTAALAAVALLAACASRPPGGAGWPGRDGPEAHPPSGLADVPDAEPRAETPRPGGPNKPYEVLGERYVPVLADAPMRERGLASWYGRKFQGRPTASGEPYDMYAMTAAHKTMPIPSYARVRNPANGREVVVRINDRGPFAAGRVIDLSYTAALKLGLLGGVAPVEVERLTNDEIRAGLPRRERVAAGPPLPPAVPAPAPAAEPPAPDDDPLMALVHGVDGGAAPASGFWLQLGAFRLRDGAAQLRERVQRAADDVAVALFDDGGDDRSTWRVQAGPYATRAEALAAADRLRGLLQLAPLVVERR